MIKFCNLYSGSSGNSTLVSTETTNILVDAGVSCAKIVKGLNQLDYSIDDIDAIIITHEHVDHTKGLAVISKKYKIPIYANQKTWKMLSNLDISEDCKFYFETNIKFEIGDFVIEPFSIPHDAADPCGFSLINQDKKITIATDIGHITETILKKMENSNLLFLESNYDNETLKCSPYPYLLKKRISSDNGHLSNDMASKTISYLSTHGVNNFILGHLSKENNFPELAYQTVYNEVSNINPNISLSVANRDNVDDITIL